MGLYPITSWKYWVEKNQKPTMPPKNNMRAKYAPFRSALVNSLSGSTGCFARASWRIKNTISTIPMANAARVGAATQAKDQVALQQ